jgi:hypothetical protein
VGTIKSQELQLIRVFGTHREPTARLARELGLSRKQLHTLRQRIQTRLNATAPTEVMVGTAFEADELYHNAGEKKHAPLRPSRPATPTGQ